MGNTEVYPKANGACAVACTAAGRRTRHLVGQSPVGDRPRQLTQQVTAWELGLRIREMCEGSRDTWDTPQQRLERKVEGEREEVSSQLGSKQPSPVTSSDFISLHLSPPKAQHSPPCPPTAEARHLARLSQSHSCSWEKGQGFEQKGLCPRRRVSGQCGPRDRGLPGLLVLQATETPTHKAVRGTLAQIAKGTKDTCFR